MFVLRFGYVVEISDLLLKNRCPFQEDIVLVFHLINVAHDLLDGVKPRRSPGVEHVDDDPGDLGRIRIKKKKLIPKVLEESNQFL